MDIEISLQNVEFFEAISSETRIKIIRMLDERKMNIKEIAIVLGISSAIVTKHIQQLEKVNIVKCENLAGKRGTQKICSLDMDHATLRFRAIAKNDNYFIHSIPVGQYTSFNIRPTCGLASESKIIGIVDDPRYFADPDHTKASILWFGSGWVEYTLPNYLLSNQSVKSMEISLEICSEAPGYNENWPSDITFYVNGLPIGLWTSPGDFGKNKGVLTPDWWNLGTNHGLLKTILVSDSGSFIDGIKTSDINITDLDLSYGKEISFKIANDEQAKNVGGISIFGRNFGNYDQDIKVILTHDPVLQNEASKTCNRRNV